jgi:hypothetical protein
MARFCMIENKTRVSAVNFLSMISSIHKILESPTGLWYSKFSVFLE